MIIQTNENLEHFCKLWTKKKILFIDTEFDRRNTYYSKLSYVTIHDGSKFWIIDALSNIDIKILTKIITNKKILKVIHGSQQDLEIFKNLEMDVYPLFDTQIAGQFCGYEQPISYANAVLKIFKINIDKNLQNSNWLKRPVTKKVIDYLKNDVRYLPGIYRHFNKILKINQNLPFFNEEMKSLNSSNKIISSSGIRKKINSKTIHNKKFQNLLTLRDDIARKKNLPKNWIFKDELISNIIKTKEYNNIKNNKNLTDLEKKVLIKNFQQIKIIKEKKNIINENIIRLINVIRSEISAKRSISEQLISNKNDIKMYLENNTKKKSLWREKIFYKITDKLINNKISISISKNNLIIN